MEDEEKDEDEKMKIAVRMMTNIDVVRSKLETSHWCYVVMDGLYNTWRQIANSRYLPAVDRGLSVQSAVR